MNVNCNSTGWWKHKTDERFYVLFCYDFWNTSLTEKSRFSLKVGADEQTRDVIDLRW